ncbi:hypothetical protein V7S43_007251 [Phytophthora oleae]|uniref:EF-hand domain-containing protein n=1 Tax=Phytophthora oleae TaxID=2107226 RepID=A0ABD3FLB6_9STRA
MDRISKAPLPKGKKWLKGGSNSSLLRHPSGAITIAPLIPVSARSHLRSAPKLTPQLHWNLTNSALKVLSNFQVGQLYELFKFYDSSTAGDELPSINSSRFLEILRDAKLLSDNTGSSSAQTNELQVDSVERIFAQAVMGKLRTFLDADGQPALTFSLFCGALMNCAMLLAPSLHPEKALRQFIPLLMETSVGYQVAIGNGLISHIPVNGERSMWTPEDSYSGNQYDEDSEQDFRDLLPFQQVIADCEDDMVAEELKQENLVQSYKVPDRLVASFQPDTLALISRKFRTFDVFDRGTVPRQEVFALLSSLGRCTDLPDPYAIVARLSTFEVPPVQPANSSGDSGFEELSLTQLLQLIEVTREAKRHSATAQLSAIKVRMDRAATVARGSIEAASSFLQLSTEENGDVADVPALRKVSGHSKRGSSKTIANYGDRGRRPSVMTLKPRKTTLPGNTTANSLMHSLSNKVQKGESKTQLAAIPSRKKTLHQRSSSTISIKFDPSITETSDIQGDCDPIQSHRTGRESDCNNDNAEQDERLADIITVQVYEPASTSNMKTIRIFLLLGGEHDGAICYTMSLLFATREIMETEGIYYTTAPNETTRSTPVLPTQNSLSNALRMLKKRVLVKLDEGYKQRPVNQLKLVDDLLRTLRDREPHFHSPVTRTSRDRPTTVPCQAELRLLTLSSMKNRCRSIVSAPSSDHFRSVLRKSSKLQPQSALPSNYRDLFTNWGLSQSENDTWIYNLNAASPLKSFYSDNQEKSARNGHISPLQFPPIKGNS